MEALMRKAISFILTSALLVSGLYLQFLEVVVARIIMGKLLVAGGFLATLGAGWLWSDFIAPMWRDWLDRSRHCRRDEQTNRRTCRATDAFVGALVSVAMDIIRVRDRGPQPRHRAATPKTGAVIK
jgi:hypothetical protein